MARDNLRAAVWVLTCKVAARGFYAFFAHKESKEEMSNKPKDFKGGEHTEFAGEGEEKEGSPPAGQLAHGAFGWFIFFLTCNPGMAEFSWLTLLGFVLLTFNSGMAIYRSDGDKYAVAFVGFSYIDLVLLFICLRLYEKAEPNSSARGNLKAAVWVLTTLLTVVLSYKVVAIMPVPVQVLVWAIAGATILGVGGFYSFFAHKESKEG
uniref:Uncharacterized protein n=1 Tax=Oryza meridionalis TaxID=40149 RepID=A0A0E0E361_9ORYZ